MRIRCTRADGSWASAVAVSVAALSLLGRSLAAQEPGCFEPPESLGSLDYDGGFNIGGYSLPDDGLELYYDAWITSTPFQSWIMRATREDTTQPFEGGARLHAAVNVPGVLVYGPRISASGELLYFSAENSPDGAGAWDIFVASRSDPDDPDALFDRADPIPGLNTAAVELAGCVSPDGREIFFNPPGLAAP
jgi:hypothetical protein